MGVDQRFTACDKLFVFRHHTQISFGVINGPVVIVIEVSETVIQFVFSEVVLFLERIRLLAGWVTKNWARRLKSPISS